MNPVNTAATMKDQSRLYFPSIDILRGFAALTVVIYHVIELFAWQDFPWWGPFLWFRAGWMGVDLFFVISGFVIGLSAFAEIDRYGIAGFKRPFMRRRFVRIIPLHYLTLLVFFFFVVPGLLFENFLTNLITHALFIHNLLFAYHGAANAANWSLGVEMQFYLMMLVVAPWMKGRYCLLTVVGMVLISWLWRFCADLYLPMEFENRNFRMFFITTQLPGMLDEFAFGLLLAHFVATGVWEKYLQGSAMFFAILLVLLVAGSLAYKLFALYGTFWGYPAMVVFYKSLLGFSFMLLIMLACRLNGRLWLRLTAPLRYLGTISYGIYLWHLLVIASMKELGWLQGGQAAITVILVTVTCAIISWHFFEQPLIRQYSKRSSL